MIVLLTLVVLAVAASSLGLARALPGDGYGHRPPPARNHTTNGRWIMPHDEDRITA